jgi:adenylate cyclase
MPRRIDSWKEVAAYLKRGVRTVQRWEQEEGLPVHRLQHDKLGSVYAFEHELDEWWAARKPKLEGASPAGGAADAGPSVAVLPFTDMSQERNQEYFCDGMAEEILIALSRIRGLRVASRMASFRFRDSGMDTAEAGRRLRVRTLLEGSVRKAGSRLRIAVQLSAAEDGYQLWSEIYDREIGDVFAVQEEIARSVARSLEVTLTPGEREALKRVPTRNLEAYDLYLRGRTYYFRYGPSDMRCAIQLFQQAIDRDPELSLAWAGMADCWSYLYLYSDRSPVNAERSESASRKAVALAPESAQALASRALALSINRHDEEAEEAFGRAIRMDAELFEAHYFYARHCFVLGKREQAAEQYEEAIRVRPEDYQARLLVAQSYEHLGRPEEARAARVRGVELAEEHLRLYPDDVRARYMAANGLAALGQKERAREWADTALEMRPEDPMLLYNIGCIYSMLGSAGDAITILEKAVAFGLRQRGWFEQDDNLDPLRSEPRFIQLLEGLR